MTNQLQGEILFKGWDGADAPNVYTPWMPVRGDFAVFGVDVTYMGNITLTWNVETRTLEDPTTSTILSSNQTTTSSGPVSVLSTTKAKQLVRYRFSTGTGFSTTQFAIFRALQPSWLADR